MVHPSAPPFRSNSLSVSPRIECRILVGILFHAAKESSSVISLMTTVIAAWIRAARKETSLQWSVVASYFALLPRLTSVIQSTIASRNLRRLDPVSLRGSRVEPSLTSKHQDLVLETAIDCDCEIRARERLRTKRLVCSPPSPKAKCRELPDS